MTICWRRPPAWRTVMNKPLFNRGMFQNDPRRRSFALIALANFLYRFYQGDS